MMFTRTIASFRAPACALACLLAIFLTAPPAPAAAAGPLDSLRNFDRLWIRAGFPPDAGVELEWRGVRGWNTIAGIGGLRNNISLYVGTRTFLNRPSRGPFLAFYGGIRTAPGHGVAELLGSASLGWSEPLDTLQFQGEIGYTLARGIGLAFTLGF